MTERIKTQIINWYTRNGLDIPTNFDNDTGIQTLLEITKVFTEYKSQDWLKEVYFSVSDIDGILIGYDDVIEDIFKSKHPCADLSTLFECEKTKKVVDCYIRK